MRAWSAVYGLAGRCLVHVQDWRTQAMPGVEQVTQDSSRRVIDVNGTLGTLEVSDCSERSALRVSARLEQLDALPGVIARVRNVFDLAAEPVMMPEDLAPLRFVVIERIGMVGQRIVNLGTGKMLGQQLLQPRAIILVVQHKSQMGALHDAGDEEAHAFAIVSS